jgi:hypothetical protein
MLGLSVEDVHMQISRLTEQPCSNALKMPLPARHYYEKGGHARRWVGLPNRFVICHLLEF